MNVVKKFKMIVIVLCYFLEMNLFLLLNRVDVKLWKIVLIKYDGNLIVYKKFIM